MATTLHRYQVQAIDHEGRPTREPGYPGTEDLSEALTTYRGQLRTGEHVRILDRQTLNSVDIETALAEARS